MATEPSVLAKLLMGDSIPQPDTPHYEAIGRFLTTFANAEASVHMLARKLSGLPDDKARIIFNGMRLADLTDLIRQLARLDQMTDDWYDEIDTCLVQLGYIATRRHSLVHRTSNFFDGKITVSNILTSKTINNHEFEVYEIELLKNMRTDCGRILLRFRYIENPKNFTAEQTKLILDLRQLPWLYKHEPPKTPNLKPREKSSKSPRQPRASRASRRSEAMKRAEKSEK